MASDPATVTKLYERIPLEAMQQVSDSYLAWYVSRVTGELDNTIAGLTTELRENDAKETSYRPSPSELSAIERLQRSGVSGTDLLDRMVEQGEDWLVLTMHRLDHFERTGLPPKDYSTWCEHALSGAYDWIDHERLSQSASNTGPLGNNPPSQPGHVVPAAPSVPDWMSQGSQSGTRSNVEDNPTAPVPSVSPRWNENPNYGSYPNAPQPPAGQRPQQAPQQAPEQDDGKGGRNIFRIFAN